MASAIHIKPIGREYEAVDFDAHSYVLTSADLDEDGRNKAGVRVRGIPMNTPLCCGCDKPIDNFVCDNCELVFVVPLAPVSLIAAGSVGA